MKQTDCKGICTLEIIDTQLSLVQTLPFDQIMTRRYRMLYYITVRIYDEVQFITLPLGAHIPLYLYLLNLSVSSERKLSRKFYFT